MARQPKQVHAHESIYYTDQKTALYELNEKLL